ncbi:MAG: lipopolysaccharide biosynthesis protein, partial [Candidatus Heimdallarchaeaceae archaeon]
MKEIKSMFAYSLPVYIVNILMTSFNLLILIYVEYSFIETGSAIIALYRFGALGLVNLLLIAGNMFRIVYRPIIFKYFEREKHKELNDLTITTSKFYLLIIIPLCFLIFAFSDILIWFFTQNEYLESIPLIPFLLAAFVLDQLRMIISYGHSLYYKNIWVLVGGISALIASTIVGYFAIPGLGLIGIGVVYLTLRTVQLVVMTTISQHYF